MACGPSVLTSASSREERLLPNDNEIIARQEPNGADLRTRDPTARGLTRVSRTHTLEGARITRLSPRGLVLVGVERLAGPAGPGRVQAWWCVPVVASGGAQRRHPEPVEAELLPA